MHSIIIHQFITFSHRNLDIAIIIVLAIAGGAYYHYIAVDDSLCRQVTSYLPMPDSNHDYVCMSLSNFLLAVAIVAGIIAVKRVIDKKIRDFRISFGLQQITNEEFEHQKRLHTRQEVIKLKESREFRFMTSLKDSKALEEWNWQVKEAAKVGRSSKDIGASSEKAGKVLAYDSDKNELENEIVKMDYELAAEGGPYFQKTGSSSIRKGSKGYKSAMKTPSTIDS